MALSAAQPTPCLHRLQEAFHRVWHVALRAIMMKYNIGFNLARVIKHLDDKAISAVIGNGSIGDRLQTTVGVQQECLLSSTLFNIFLERIMTDPLENHESTVSIGGRTICQSSTFTLLMTSPAQQDRWTDTWCFTPSQPRRVISGWNKMYSYHKWKFWFTIQCTFHRWGLKKFRENEVEWREGRN